MMLRISTQFFKIIILAHYVSKQHHVIPGHTHVINISPCGSSRVLKTLTDNRTTDS